MAHAGSSIDPQFADISSTYSFYLSERLTTTRSLTFDRMELLQRAAYNKVYSLLSDSDRTSVNMNVCHTRLLLRLNILSDCLPVVA